MDHIILVWLPSLTYIKMRNHLQLDMREHLSTMGGHFESCIINKGFLWSTFSINSYIFLTSQMIWSMKGPLLLWMNSICLVWNHFSKKSFCRYWLPKCFTLLFLNFHSCFMWIQRNVHYTIKSSIAK